MVSEAAPAVSPPLAALTRCEVPRAESIPAPGAEAVDMAVAIVPLPAVLADMLGSPGSPAEATPHTGFHTFWAERAGEAHGAVQATHIAEP